MKDRDDEGAEQKPVVAVTAAMALAQEILILRTIVAAMMKFHGDAKPWLEHYKSMLRGFVAEVTRR